ncbi:MAG: low molecular weight phosphatase family protein [Archaeoglobaceae archaeon]
MKVLFVCIHNTARSVMAEAIFNSMAKSWRAESAGIEKAERVDETVRRLLAERGLRAKERPRTIDEVNLDEYDLIVTVCEESSCFVLPTEKPVESWHIENPVGKDEEVYRRVFAEIEERVRELVRRLENGDGVLK